MATAINTYQCPACTGPLHFAAGPGKLECEHYGSSPSGSGGTARSKGGGSS